MYVATKGGEAAIANAHRLLAKARRGAKDVPAITDHQVEGQLALAVARVMAEGSLYDPALAALAIRQARGDLVEATFLVRAYRITLPRFGTSQPIDTAAMQPTRRISATFKDLPGGQLLGPTFDYTHRLLDFTLAAEAEAEADGKAAPDASAPPLPESPAHEGGPAPRVTDLLGAAALIEPSRRAGSVDEEPDDLTRAPLTFPATRPLRLQALARADEGFLLGLAYSTQRGFGGTHAFVGELRVGAVSVDLFVPELGMDVSIGEITVTEVETVNQFTGSKSEPAQFTRGYGLVFGHSERKAMAMALVDRALRAEELGEDLTGAPAQDAEFVLAHSDNVQASGFLEHLKLPHYVDFQAELALVRRLRAEASDAAMRADIDTAEAQARAGDDSA